MRLRNLKPTSTIMRRGAVMIAALVCLMTVVSLGGLTLQSLALQHRQANFRLLQLQSQYLAESAVERAAAALSRSPEYRGETWSIAADQLDHARAASLEIQVETVPNHLQQRRVTVIARWPADHQPPIVSRKQVLLTITSGIKS